MDRLTREERSFMVASRRTDPPHDEGEGAWPWPLPTTGRSAERIIGPTDDWRILGTDEDPLVKEQLAAPTR